MNPVEIEEAVSELADQTFDRQEFAYSFFKAFGNKKTTIDRVRKNKSYHSEIIFGGGVDGKPQRSYSVVLPQNIHIGTCETGRVAETLSFLRDSPKTKKFRAKFLLATDGEVLEAEEIVTGDVLSCEWNKLDDQFGFFLPLAGITTVQALKDNPIDIKATARLNRLYVELLRTNPDWDGSNPDLNMNRFMAQLIFCFFAEDTGIFYGDDLFTITVEEQSSADNAHEVIKTLFEAMATPIEERTGPLTASWVSRFRFVNGGLFTDITRVPTFSRIARSYLLHAGKLDWKSINPDIFGSMTQAIADSEERGQLGLHYTSIPNILKVLNPLFLDDLREKLKDSWDSPQKLLNLRRQLESIRVFDPACGSGNFLVVAYKQLREIENDIVEQRIKILGENARRRENTRSVISTNNFFGIEIKEFACEIARLSLLIAEYQCDVLYLGQQLAADAVLPLSDNRNIHSGNALHFDWAEVCPISNEDNIQTFICGNPPYKGSQTQTKTQKRDLEIAFRAHSISTRQLDYVAGWFIKAAEYLQNVNASFAFVSTNSLCQGRIVPILWPVLFSLGVKIEFAHTSFKWSNLASRNAGVVVIVIALTKVTKKPRIYSIDRHCVTTVRRVDTINPYLTSTPLSAIQGRSNPVSIFPSMSFGNMPVDGGHFLLSDSEYRSINVSKENKSKLFRRIVGSAEFIRGTQRYCVWVEDHNLNLALMSREISDRIHEVNLFRKSSVDKSTINLSVKSHQFREMHYGKSHSIVIPSVSSEHRAYLPVGLINDRTTISNAAFGIYDAPIWCLAVIASRIHLIWIETVCGKLGTGFRYSKTLGWNTFPFPPLIKDTMLTLSNSAIAILHAREQYFPATIAEMYDPKRLDKEFPLVRQAHQANDDKIERIYSPIPFKNDTERLEKLFELYSEMTGKEQTL